MSLRTVLFWTHLTAGIVAGSVVFIMSFTGAALSLQPQILAWAERDLRMVAPPSPGTGIGPAPTWSRSRPDAGGRPARSWEKSYKQMTAAPTAKGP